MNEVGLIVILFQWRPILINNKMIYFTLLIYIIPSQEAAFNDFEAIAIPLIAKYNGQLQLRLRPEPSAIIELTIEAPYEIHFGSFDSEANFQAFMKDETRKTFLHLKEKSIKTTVLIIGSKLN